MSSRRAQIVIATLLAAATAGCDVDTDNSPEPGGQGVKGARVGETLTLEGQGREMRVTVVSVLDPAPVSPRDEPEAGKRFVGIDLRLENTGDKTYEDAPFDGASLATSEQVLGESTLASRGRCELGPRITIRPGEQHQGCMLFEVPREAELVTFEFTLSPGAASRRAGQWRLGADA
jgi:hypothetical protein